MRHSQLKSATMEKVGCERALKALMEKVHVTGLVTDASSQIIKLLGTFFLLYRVQYYIYHSVFVNVEDFHIYEIIPSMMSFISTCATSFIPNTLYITLL